MKIYIPILTALQGIKRVPTFQPIYQSELSI